MIAVSPVPLTAFNYLHADCHDRFTVYLVPITATRFCISPRCIMLADLQLGSIALLRFTVHPLTTDV